MFGDSSNYVTYEVIIEHMGGKWLLTYSTSAPSLPVKVDNDGKVTLVKGADKIKEKINTHISYINNTHEGTNYWFVLRDMSDNLIPFMDPIMQQIISEDNGVHKRIYDIQYSEFKDIAVQDPIPLTKEVTAIYEALGPTTIVDLVKFPNGLESTREVADTHIHFCLFNVSKASTDLHKMMISMMLFRVLEMPSYESSADRETVRRNLKSMQNQINTNRKAKSTDSIHADAVKEHLEIELGSQKFDVAEMSNNLLSALTQETITFGASAALDKAVVDQDCYRYSNLKILAFTWNVAGFAPENSMQMKEFLNAFDRKNLPHIVTIGLQEVVELKGLGGAFGLFSSEEKTLKKWADCFINLLYMIDPQYYLASQEMLVGMASFNFIHRSVVNKVASLGIEEVKTGMMGMVGTKGYLVSSIAFEDKTLRLCNAHFKSGEDNAESRAATIDNLYLQYCNPSKSDLVLLFGDLNMRLCIDNQDYARAIKDGRVNNPAIEWNYLLSKDEVKSGMQPCLQNNFFEQTITFPMTYRFMKNAKEPTYTSDRIAAWTDRLFLWHSKQRNMSINVPAYHQIPFSFSDHWAVYGTYDIQFTEFDQVKAMEKYNRELYQKNSKDSWNPSVGQTSYHPNTSKADYSQSGPQQTQYPQGQSPGWNQGYYPVN